MTERGPTYTLSFPIPSARGQFLEAVQGGRLLTAIRRFDAKLVAEHDHGGDKYSGPQLRALGEVRTWLLSALKAEGVELW